MSPLWALLLLAIAATHYGYDVACAVLPSMAHSAKGLFYVLRGCEGAVLFAVIAYLRPAVFPVCLWGMVEEGETAICRLASGPLDKAPLATAWSGLCGDEIGVPLYMLGITAAAILVTRKNRQ